MFHIPALTDFSLLLLRIIVGLIFADSGYEHLKDPEARSKSIGMSKSFTIFLGAAELAGAAGIMLGVLTQLAALGLIVLMGGAVQKKVMVWKTGFWGTTQSPGWYYETLLVATLLVIIGTDGGNWVLLG
jgi:putative oxidoreductase